MAVKLEDTGERMVPELHKGKNIYGAHIGRYKAGASLVKGKVVLDIACGSGYGTKLMSKDAKKVIGIDIDEETVRYAKENYSGSNIEYLQGSGTEIPITDNSVDVVVTYETIEHIDDYEKFLQEIKRVLKKDGLALISTPNDEEYIEDNHFHLHEFTYPKLQKLATKYFKNHKSYFQSLWLYSTILPENSQTKEWEMSVNTINTCSIKTNECIYFFLICSDRGIAEEIESLGVIGEHYRLREVQATNLKNHAKHARLMEVKEEVSALNKKLEEEKQKSRNLQKQLDAIYRSKAWKLARKISKARQVVISPKKQRD